jgi:hypothetical protein
LGIGDWGLGIGPNPQSPIPNPQSPIPILILEEKFKNLNFKNKLNKYIKIEILNLIIMIIYNLSDVIKKIINGERRK